MIMSDGKQKKRSADSPFLSLFLVGATLLIASAILCSLWGGANIRQKEATAREYQTLIFEQAAEAWVESANRLLHHLADHAGLNAAIGQDEADPAQIALRINEAVRPQQEEPYFSVSVVSLSRGYLWTDTSHSLDDFDLYVSAHTLRADNSILIYPDLESDRDELVWLMSMSSGQSYRDALVALHFPIARLEERLLRQTGLADARLRLLMPEAPLMRPPGSQQPVQAAAQGIRDAALPDGTTVVPLGDTNMAMAWWQDANTGGLASLPLIVSVISASCVLLLGAAIWLTRRSVRKPLLRLLREYDVEPDPGDSDYGALDRYIRKQHHEINDWQEQFNGFIPDLKLSTFQHLLWGELSEAELTDKVERLKLPLAGELFYIAVATIDEYGHFLNRYSKNDQLTIHHVLRKQAMEIFSGVFTSVTFTPRHGMIAILIGAGKSMAESDRLVRPLADQFREWTRSHYEFTVSVAISRPRRGYSSMSGSYHEASSLLNYKMTFGNDSTIMSGDVWRAAVPKPSYNLLQHCKQIARLVVQGHTAEATDEVDKLLEQLARHPYKSETALGIFAHLLGELEYMLFELQINIHDVFEEHIYDVLYSKSTLAHVRSWLDETVFASIRQYLARQHVSKQKQVAQQVIHQIHDRYDEDLTLQHVADELDISVSQLSRLFKEETGRTFSESLIQYRMQKAAELLENTDMSIKDIADKMRYTNVQNFSRIFKQVVGLPPGEYRKTK
ncbi:helix-turn-helix domain-containing protein [Paenibacillaceae bacterium WGS1546]|uniref:helix-turn-helix domain-containing protein n=1 Tax=Cohnella sp. WGS1546 TaxID=3366810 RepID=UPI00372D61AF